MSVRDCWATPKWLTDLLPAVSIDPCSNAQSTVRADVTYDLSRGEDGLARDWFGVVYVNPPYSDVKPWAEKLLGSHAVTAAAFLINVDPSTAWWKLLTERLPFALMFHKRIQFTPPPGVKPSTNNKPQALLMDRAFLSMCSPELLAMGVLWRVEMQEAA